MYPRPGGLPCSAFCPGQHALLASGSLIDGDPGSVPPQGLPAGQSGSSGLGPCSWAPPPLLAPSPRGEAAADPECPTGGLLLGTSSQITRTTAAQGWLGSRSFEGNPAFQPLLLYQVPLLISLQASPRDFSSCSFLYDSP